MPRCQGLAISTLASWCHVVHSRDVSPHRLDGLAMSGLEISVAQSELSKKLTLQYFDKYVLLADILKQYITYLLISDRS